MCWSLMIVSYYEWVSEKHYNNQFNVDVWELFHSLFVFKLDSVEKFPEVEVFRDTIFLCFDSLKISCTYDLRAYA